MAQKAEILDRLTGLSQEVTHARESLLKGEVVTIDKVHERIETECQAIVELEPDDAAEVKPKLDDLLENLRLFSEEINYVQAKVAEILSNTDKEDNGDEGSGT